MKSFEDSDFVVTFTGECPCSRLIRTWDRVQAYIDYELFQNDPICSVRKPDCELHDADNWSRVAYSEDGDHRHEFISGEFSYCVGLQVTRLTNPVNEEWLEDRELAKEPPHAH